jgi:cyclophilin family peptidyl-prolyl cis-trans isomerase
MTNPTVTFDTNVGTFRAELFRGRAPVTAENFITLAEKGFYDGLIFHRVIDGFMIQGGCPDGTGRSGPGYTIDDEFHPELRHDSEGILSMANAGPNTGGSQFFVTLAPTDWLDDRHAVFGRVVEGMSVVREIGKRPTSRGNRPADDVVMETVSVDRGGHGAGET